MRRASFREFTRKSTTEAPMRRNNAKKLRAGRIPKDILEGQKTFLRSLENSTTPEYRTYRYGLIADGEVRLGQLAESNVAEFRKPADYYGQLSRKYANAEQRPWEPVTPDPPRP